MNSKEVSRRVEEFDVIPGTRPEQNPRPREDYMLGPVRSNGMNEMNVRSPQTLQLHDDSARFESLREVVSTVVSCVPNSAESDTCAHGDSWKIHGNHHDGAHHMVKHGSSAQGLVLGGLR